MKRGMKTALCVAAAMVLAGAILFGAAYRMGARPLQVLNSRSWSGMANLSLGFDSDYRAWKNEYRPEGAYTAEAEGVSALDVRWLAGSVTLRAWDGAEIAFTERAGAEIGEKIALRWGVEAGTLYIQYCDASCREELPEKTLEVLLPRALAESLTKLEFSGVSANLDSREVNADRIELDSTSGDLAFAGIFAQGDAETVSGGVTLESLGLAREAEIGTTSGEMRVSGRFETLETDTVSGTLSCADSAQIQTLEAGSTSGSVRLDLDAPLSAAKVNTVSGNVRLALPEDSGFTLNFDTVSGDLDCGFAVEIGRDDLRAGDGAGQLRIETVSGDLEIQKR